MFCRQCGAKIEDENLQKCSSCGTKVGKGRRFCQNCGKQYPHNDETCAYCGFSFVPLPVNKRIENKNDSSSGENKQVLSTLNPNPIPRQQPIVDEDNINPIAKKIMNQKNQEKILVGYGKKVTENPLLEKTKSLKQSQKNEAQNQRSFNDVVSTTPKFIQQPEKQASDNNSGDVDLRSFAKTQNPERVSGTKTKENTNQDVNENQVKTASVDKIHNQNNSITSISTFSILSFLLSLATLVTCQVVYAAGAFIFVIIDLIKNKNKNPLIVSIVLIAITVIAVYFGISFYIV